MAKLAHITPVRMSSSASVRPTNLDGLLDAYSSWLFFERHILHIGRFGLRKAVDLIDTVQVDNAGALFRLPIDADYRTTQRRHGARRWFRPRLG
jgi:hypothetical protein